MSLSDNTLFRAGRNYRNGYRDGERAAEPDTPTNLTNLIDAPPTARAIDAFASGDYKRGYMAGANDRYWFYRHEQRYRVPTRDEQERLDRLNAARNRFPEAKY